MDLQDVDPKYTSMCSKKTLQEDEKGFFGQLAGNFLELPEVHDWSQEMWSKGVYGKRYVVSLSQNREIFTKLNDLFSVESVYRKKNLENAMKVRKLAGKELTSGNYFKALTYCNQAVIMSPTPGPVPNSDQSGENISLAMALWMRAECLMRMNDDELALRDLQSAMRCNLPSQHRGLLFHRQGECYKKLGEFTKAKISLELSIKLTPNNLPFQEKVGAEVISMGFELNNNHKKPMTPKPTKKNIDEPFAEQILEIAYEKDFGRYMKAKSDISVGDTVMVEEPYCGYLKQSTHGTHCNNCFDKLKAPYPCPGCANVAFCSPECRDIAMQTYHKYECHFMGLFLGSGMSVLCRVALRMVTQNELRKSLEIYNQYLLPREQLESYDNQDEQLATDDKLKLIYNLCTHSERRTHDDYLTRATMAFFLLKCLQKSGYFDSKKGRNLFSEDETLSSEEIAIFAMLLYHIQMLHFNAHEIEEVQKVDTKKTNNATIKSIAVGIYPTVSLFNHDCHQGVGRFFIGKKMVLKALMPIQHGDAVSENYGPMFTDKTKYARQRILRSRYWFKCRCTPCVEIWPNCEQMGENTIPVLRCLAEGCRGKIVVEHIGKDAVCTVCKFTLEPNRVKELHNEIDVKCCEKYQEGAVFLEEAKYDRGIEVLVPALKLFYKMAYPPHRKTHLAEQNLKHCYALSYADNRPNGIINPLYQ